VNLLEHMHLEGKKGYIYGVKPRGGDLTEPGVEPTSSMCMTGDRTTDLKRSAVMSGTGIHRLIYRDICVAATAHIIW